MRVSLIVAFYKDIEALRLVVEALRLQDYKNFELIVAEDNDDPTISDYINTITDIDVLHTSQIDDGIHKARSQNNAIIKSTGDYLIFIDGDCIPYHSFISSHAKLAEKGHILTGRRVNLGSIVSTLIRRRRLKASTLERFFFIMAPALLLDGATHIGQGMTFKPDGFIYRNIISKRKNSSINLLGCNFSCFKDDLLAVNGFDESYLGESCLSDDTDLQWRFDAYGLKFKSCKMAASVFHLHHGVRPRKTIDLDTELSKMLANKKKQIYIAKIGISSHDQ